MATGAGVWFRVYLAGVVALLIYVAAVTVGSLPQ
jgi:hypothetical protein